MSSRRSPVRPPQNLSLSYPTPDSAPRPSRSIRAVPPTPTPLGRPGRAESKILGANGTDDNGGAIDDEAEDRGEGPSRLQIVRRIDWGQGGEEAEHQCGYRVRNSYRFVETRSLSKPLLMHAHTILFSTNSKNSITNTTRNHTTKKPFTPSTRHSPHYTVPLSLSGTPSHANETPYEPIETL